MHVCGEGPPILFLHGVGGGAWSWSPQVERFSSSNRLFVWEARGHGQAATIRDAGLAEYYRDALEALAAAAGAAGPVTIVAHSMGGLLAMALAADYPADVAKLFLVDPVYSDGTDAAYGHVAPAFGAMVRWLCTPVIRSFERDGWLSRTLSRSLFERTFTNRERMEAAWQFQRRQVPFEYQKMLRESFVRPEGFELRDFASEIASPVFLLDVARRGVDSRFPKLCATLQHRLGPQFHHAALDGGHYLQLDRYEEVDRYLEEFLTDSPPAG